MEPDQDLATILIPDISGFTEFSTSTELEHGALIINELLNVIVESNSCEFKVGEVEGDAVLFYKPGEAIPRKVLVEQCIEMFRNFHRKVDSMVKVIDCPCGTCQTAGILSLKFVAHRGRIKEINVANFVKATGKDMIVAHRLLKNSIASKEYILFTKNSVDSKQDAGENTLQWNESQEEYESIGKIEFQYALLGDLRNEVRPL